MSEKTKIGRRTFFAALGGAAAAGVAAKIAAKPAIPALAEQAPEPEGTGYRLSDHVKKYYRTTTI